MEIYIYILIHLLLLFAFSITMAGHIYVGFAKEEFFFALLEVFRMVLSLLTSDSIMEGLHHVTTAKMDKRRIAVIESGSSALSRPF